MHTEGVPAAMQDGRVFEDRLNYVYGTDCMNILAKLPCESVDLVIADPPYYRMKGGFDFCVSF